MGEALAKSKIQNKSSALEPVSERIIDVAEQLFGERGIDGVSLREISSAAGTSNNYAVQYHFGDLLGLLRAISKKRMPEVEVLRAQFLMRAKEEGRLDDIRTLLEILHRPLIEHTNGQGERAYARFILAALHSPIAQNATATDLFEAMPIATHVIDLIASLNKALSPVLLMERQRLVTLMVLNSVFNRRIPWVGAVADAALIDNALDMATAALLAPVSPSVNKLVKK